jgi:hypothetical protein
MSAKIIGAILALMGLGFLCFSLYLAGQEVLLAVTGHSTTGALTEKTSSYDVDNYTTYYYLSYSYKDDNGQEHTGRSDASKEMYDDYVEGAPIPVVYSSILPSASRIRPASENLLASVLLALMGVPTLWYGLWVLLRRIHWENKMARLMTNGERRIGRLVAVEEDKGEREEDYTPLVLIYAFTDKTGRERTGKTFHVGRRDHDFWKGRIGCPLDVRVNPADPEDHIALVEESKHLG